MRPVNKGEAPKKAFLRYQDARPYLEEMIGRYCSYCEMPILNAPEVEHVEAKALGGEELAWDNLLLSCKYCNTRKGQKVAAGERDEYLWPDTDDTFHAFSYTDGIPKVNKSCRGKMKREDFFKYQKAENLYELVQLGHQPSMLESDSRYQSRLDAWRQAKMFLELWRKIKEKYSDQGTISLIVVSAKNTGFFSCWMEVFKDEPLIKNALVKAFPGTRAEFCL